MYLFERIRSRTFDWNEFVNVTSTGKPKEKINHALQYADEHGLLKLGEGNTRRVFVLSSRMVLKIALDDYGRQQNKREAGAYKKRNLQLSQKFIKTVTITRG